MTYIDIDAPLFQWDRGREITIALTRPAVQKVHLAYKGENRALSIKPYKKNGKTLAGIPDILLQKAGKLNVYLVVGAGEDEHTIEARTLTIFPKEKPDEYIYTDDEKLLWHEFEQRISIIENDLFNLDLDSYATQEYVGKTIETLPRAYEKISTVGAPSGSIFLVDLAQFVREPGVSFLNYYNDCAAEKIVFQFGSEQITCLDMGMVSIFAEFAYGVQTVVVQLPQGRYSFEHNDEGYSLNTNPYLTQEELSSGAYGIVRSVNGATPDRDGSLELDYTTQGVRYVEQELTTDEVTQARKNLGLYHTEVVDEEIVIHQIEEEFIPDTIARVENVPNNGGYELVGSIKIDEPVRDIVMMLSKPCSHLRIAAFRRDAGFFVSKSNINTAVNGNLTVWAHKYGEISDRGIWVQGNGTISGSMQQPLAFCDITVLPNGRVAAIGWVQRSSGGYSGTPSAMTSDWSSMARDGLIYELYFNESGNSNLINEGVELYVWGC